MIPVAIPVTVSGHVSGHVSGYVSGHVSGYSGHASVIVESGIALGYMHANLCFMSNTVPVLHWLVETEKLCDPHVIVESSQTQSPSCTGWLF